MSTRIMVEVWENRQRKEASEFDGPVELGRQRDRDEGLFSRKQEDNRWRWVIARRDETTVGRNQILLTPLNSDKVKVTNGSDKQPIRFLDRADLQPGASCDAALPLHVILGPTKTVHVRKAAGADGPVHSLADATMPPRSAAAAPGSRFPSLAMPPAAQGSSRELMAWMNNVLEVLQAVAESADFLDRAARAIVESVGLDAARVLVYQGGDWRPKSIQAAGTQDPTMLRPASRSVLDRVMSEKKTFWQVPGQDGSASESLAGLETVIASPILNKDGEVIGALYGERRRAPRPGASAISEAEAMLIELLARGVAAGMALERKEREACDLRSQFEQFFTPELAQQLTSNPDMLEGHDREVTIMFCDIRGFSTVSNRIGAELTIKWCRDVLTVLSECVMAAEGVVVDYVGDGLMAMWGAPGEQKDHAARACRAALHILEKLPGLNERWKEVINADTNVAVGINTGVAQVGNVGSRVKFKYGALGHTVNVASRVQGVTKYFKAKAMITGQTHKQMKEEIEGRGQKLEDEFVTRRLGKVKVVGIDEVLELWEVFPPEWEYAARAREEYDKALKLFENEEFSPAARTLGAWRAVCPTDDPVLVLLFRAVRAMVEGTPPGHPVWLFTEKGQ